MKFYIQFIILMLSFNAYCQSDIDKVLKGSEIIINGLSFLQSNKTETKSTNSKIVESVCIKNKLTDKKSV